MAANVVLILKQPMIDKQLSIRIDRGPSVTATKSHVAGSSMRLVRLKHQGPGPDKGPDRPVQKNF